MCNCVVYVARLRLHCFVHVIVCVVWNLTLRRQNSTEQCRHLKEKRRRGDWQRAHTSCHKHLSSRAAEWHQHADWHGRINLLFHMKLGKKHVWKMCPGCSQHCHLLPLGLTFWPSSVCYSYQQIRTSHSPQGLFNRAPKLPLERNQSVKSSAQVNSRTVVGSWVPATSKASWFCPLAHHTLK